MSGLREPAVLFTITRSPLLKLILILLELFCAGRLVTAADVAVPRSLFRFKLGINAGGGGGGGGGVVALTTGGGDGNESN